MHWRIEYRRAGASSNNRDGTILFAKTKEEAIAKLLKMSPGATILLCKPAH